MIQLAFTKDMSKYEHIHYHQVIGGVDSVARLRFANQVLNILKGDLMLEDKEIMTVAEAMKQYISNTEIVSSAETPVKSKRIKMQ